MNIKTMKISYAVESVIQISEDGAAPMLRNYRLIRDGIVRREAVPEGYRNAFDKLPADADDDLILRTILVRSRASSSRMKSRRSTPRTGASRPVSRRSPIRKPLRSSTLREMQSRLSCMSATATCTDPSA